MFTLLYLVNNEKPWIKEEYNTYEEINARVNELKTQFMDNSFKVMVYDPNGNLVQEGTKE